MLEVPQILLGQLLSYLPQWNLHHRLAITRGQHGVLYGQIIFVAYRRHTRFRVRDRAHSPVGRSLFFCCKSQNSFGLRLGIEPEMSLARRDVGCTSWNIRVRTEDRVGRMPLLLRFRFSRWDSSNIIYGLALQKGEMVSISVRLAGYFLPRP